MGNKVYLAARYSRASEMREVRELLRAKGYEVVSRWIDGHDSINNGEGSAEARITDRMRYASEDTEDVYRSDIVISFTEEPRKPSTNRGGRHVEFGMGYAWGKRCIVVGWCENVFHCLPNVDLYETREAMLDGLPDILPHHPYRLGNRDYGPGYNLHGTEPQVHPPHA